MIWMNIHIDRLMDTENKLVATKGDTEKRERN